MSEHRPTNPIAPSHDELWDLADAAVSGRATPLQTDRLNALIESYEDAAQFYAAYLDLHADLAWRRRGPVAPAFAEVSADQPAPNSPRAKLRVSAVASTPTLRPPKRLVLAAAAALLLAAAAVAVFLFAFNSKPETRDPKLPPQPIATFIDATEGTLIVADRIANPGDEIGPGEIALDAGSADFRLHNGVAVRLTGATTLTVHPDQSATLAVGVAEFDCPPGVKGYRVNLPGGARVVDLGTRFEVEVDAEVQAVRVTEGRVRWEHAAASAGPQIIRAGQIAAVSGGRFTISEFATISYAGADLTTHDAWRTDSVAKPLDADGDNVYGTDGYLANSWAAGTTLPDYATVAVNAPNSIDAAAMASVTYLALDHPAGGADVETGVNYYDDAGSGNEQDFYTITLTRAADFRFGIITDVADFTSVSPARLRVRQIVGGSGNSGLIPAIDQNLDGDYYFFDIVGGQAGDVFVVSGVSQLIPGQPDSNGLGGVTFDTLDSDESTRKHEKAARSVSARLQDVD